ncbi:hypothetical protein JCM3770_001482 [Rhodotorula araucariae]
MPPADKMPMQSVSFARDAANPYNIPVSSGAAAGEDDEGDEEGGGGARGRSRANGVRHLSCENCRVRKMKCSRQSPCLSCRMRGDKCIWIGQAPNGSADEDELERSQNEVNRLKKLVDLLLARLEEQDEAEQQLAFYQQAQQAQQSQHNAHDQQQAQHVQHDTHHQGGSDLVVGSGSNGHDAAYAHHAAGQAQRGYTVVLPGAGSPQSEPRSNGGAASSLHALAPMSSHPGDIPIMPLHTLPPSTQFARQSPSGLAPVQFGGAGSSGGVAPASDKHLTFAAPASASGYTTAGSSGSAGPYGARSSYGAASREGWRSG